MDYQLELKQVVDYPRCRIYREFIQSLIMQELKNTEEIIQKLEPYIDNISFRTYYRKRQAAIEALSTILWG